MDKDKIDGKTLNMVNENIEGLKHLFPEVFVEDKIDFDKLQNLLGNYIDSGVEKYQMTWKGKIDAIRLIQKQSTGTLRPCIEESKNWDKTENLYIEGDNLEVLKLLQSSYLNKIKMIYIDPPYNTGNDFVYEDDFTDNIANYKKITEQATKSNPETAGRYHTNWLNMMYPRLKLARNLLTDDGVIFISIDDNEQANLKKICDEIFGEDNFIAILPRITKKAGKTTDAIAINHDFLLLYTRSNNVTFNLQKHTDEGFKFEDEFVETRGKYKLNQTLDYDSLGYSPSLDYIIEFNGKTFYPGNSLEKYNDRKRGKYANRDWAWRWSKDLFEFGLKNGFIVVKDYDDYSRIYTKTYQNVTIERVTSGFEIKTIERTKPLSSLEFVDNQYSNDNAKKNLLTLFENSPFDYSKPISLLKALVSFSTSQTDIILDFFSGSSTTANAVMQLNAEDGGNRKFIMVQLPEKVDENSEAYKAGFKNICEIGKERILRAGEKLVSELKEFGKERKKEGKTQYFVETGPQINGAEWTDSETHEVVDVEYKNILEPKDVYKFHSEKLDTGFKVFKLDSSNLLAWNNTPTTDESEIEKRIQNSMFYLKDNRKDIDVVYEIMLKNGLSLTLLVAKHTIKDVECYVVDNPAYKVLICLQPNITLESVEAMLKELDVIGTFIFADKCFSDANSLINTREILKREERKMRLF